MRGSRVISRSLGDSTMVVGGVASRVGGGGGGVHRGTLGEADEESKLDIGLRGVRKGHYAIM